MRAYAITRPTEEALKRALLCAAGLGKLCGRREVFGQGRVPARLCLAEMRGVARAARRCAADLTVFAAHVEATIGGDGGRDPAG